MRHLLYSLLLLTSALTFAQAPSGISYQAVVRDANGMILTEQAIGARFTIRQGSASGLAIFTETHTIQTDANGVISLVLGSISGTTIGTIDWTNGPYFVQSELDLSGGSNYTINGTHQLLSVPFAFHATQAESLVGGVEEADPLFINWDRTEGIEITEAQISDLQPYLTAELDPAVSDNFDFTNAQAGDLLQFDGSKWVKLTPEFAAANHGHNPADTETDGFMRATDKAKLDGLENATGDETKINAGDNVSISGTGTTEDPYVVNATVPSGNGHYLGEEYLGGIIFYLYTGSDGQQHGLVVAKEETLINLGNFTNVGADRSFDGAYNTGLFPSNPATEWITTNLGEGWYIPAIDELVLLWSNRFHVNATLTTLELAPMTIHETYMSSTEVVGSTSGIWSMGRTQYSGMLIVDSKMNHMKLRAVKSF